MNYIKRERQIERDREREWKVLPYKTKDLKNCIFLNAEWIELKERGIKRDSEK